MPYTSSVRNLLPEEAVIMPPPGGPAIVSVLEKQFSNAIDQQIMLRTDARTPGQNAIHAVFFGTRNYSRMNGNSLSYQSITDRRIDEEMREELPGVRMVRSPYYVQNNYGPFGYAFGHGRGSDLCMYGWQQIRPGQDSLAAFGQAGTIQVRVRFCEAGASEDDLLGIMYGYTIAAAVEAYGWNPYGEQAGPPPLLGETGAPTYPRKAYDPRPERVADTEKVLKSSTVSTTPVTRAATSSVATGDEINVDVVRLPPGSLPSAGYVGTPAVPGAYTTGLPSVGAPASTIPTPGRQAPAASAVPAAVSPTIGAPVSAPAAANIPVPARSSTTSSPATSVVGTPAAGRSSIPAPPCRLLPGSTTVSCE
ncbi:cellulose biosynthesis protein BcsN [Martelella soudanensis]|uniref:cellulose biosynthesis protein BcsN n=1 Tax=unclassified Martelella TaxID=2629616 RepID=UPI0015DFDDE9|nr:MULTISPECIES: cellulose biosynthesis protein BcsN [unclassified Martelella]